MARGTGRGALAELVLHGETGLAVDEAATPLAHAWDALLGSPERRIALGARARARVERLFRPEHLAERTAGLYAAAQQAKRSRAELAAPVQIDVTSSD